MKNSRTSTTKTIRMMARTGIADESTKRCGWPAGFAARGSGRPRARPVDQSLRRVDRWPASRRDVVSGGSVCVGHAALLARRHAFAVAGLARKRRLQRAAADGLACAVRCAVALRQAVLLDARACCCARRLQLR